MPYHFGVWTWILFQRSGSIRSLTTANNRLIPTLYEDIKTYGIRSIINDRTLIPSLISKPKQFQQGIQLVAMRQTQFAIFANTKHREHIPCRRLHAIKRSWCWSYFKCNAICVHCGAANSPEDRRESINAAWPIIAFGNMRVGWGRGRRQTKHINNKALQLGNGRR